MTVNTYPDFKPGQTLTAGELDLLGAHAWHRDQLVGRMIGFGVNGGLGGSFVGNVLTIQPGLAIDQSGEPLVLRDARSITMASGTGAPTTLSATPFPFIGAQADTWSVVLTATDVETFVTGCTETGCVGHSGTHTRGVTLHVVAGRVTGPRFAFASHPIHEITPLMLTAQGQAIGNIGTFTSRLGTVLTNLGGAVQPLAGAVSTITVGATELQAIRGYKVAWLNTVLMAAMDLVRCRALSAIETFRVDTHPGVVLGAIRRNGAAWEFDCEYKHHWEPPKGLSQALLGGACGSACSISEGYLVSVLNGYAPPVPPPTPPPPPTGGGGTILDPPLIFCRKGDPRCGILVWPGPDIKQVWPPRELYPPKQPWQIFPPQDKYVLPGYRVLEEMEDVFGLEHINQLNDGILVADTLIGHHGVNVQATLEAEIRDHGGNPTVTVLTEAEFADAIDTPGMSGYQIGTSVGISDNIVVTVNGSGIAVGMGSIPGIVAARQAGAIGQIAMQATVDAGTSLAKVEEFETTFDRGMVELEGGFAELRENLGAIRNDVIAIKGAPGDLSVLEHKVGLLEAQTNQVMMIGERVAKLEGKALAQVGDLGTKTYTADVGNTMAEFAQSAVAAIKTIEDPKNQRLTEYINAVEIKQGELEIAVRAGDPEMVAGATVELLDSMRTMIGGAGVDAGAKRKLDAQFRAMQGMLG